MYLYLCTYMYTYISKHIYLSTFIYICICISVTGTKFGLRKRQRSSDASIGTRDSGIDASRCTDKLRCFLCTCTVVFPPEDQSRQS